MKGIVPHTPSGQNLLKNAPAVSGLCFKGLVTWMKGGGL